MTERFLREYGGQTTAELIALEAEAAVQADRPEAGETLRRCDDRYFANDEPIADRLFAWIKASADAIRASES